MDKFDSESQPEYVALSESDLAEFAALWKRETGQNIDRETAREYAMSIIDLVDSVVRWKGSQRQKFPDQHP